MNEGLPPHKLRCLFSVGESIPVTKTPLPKVDGSVPWKTQSEGEYKRHVLFCGTEVIHAKGACSSPVKAVVLQTGQLEPPAFYYFHEILSLHLSSALNELGKEQSLDDKPHICKQRYLKCEFNYGIYLLVRTITLVTISIIHVLCNL